MARAREIWANRRAEIARRQDEGVADPAIVMITIVVLVVLALAGMYIGRGFVEQARDTNAQNDLARVAASQEFYAASASKYTADLDQLKNGRVSFTVSKDVNIEIAASDIGWVASATHADSGNVFYRASDSSTVYQVGTGSGADATSISGLPVAPVPAGANLSWAQVEQTKN